MLSLIDLALWYNSAALQSLDKAEARQRAVSPSLVPPLYHEGQQLEGGTRLWQNKKTEKYWAWIECVIIEEELCYYVWVRSVVDQSSSYSPKHKLMMSVEGHMTNLTWKLHFIILSPDCGDCLNNLGGLWCLMSKIQKDWHYMIKYIIILILFNMLTVVLWQSRFIS